jgi:phytol kinase
MMDGEILVAAAVAAAFGAVLLAAETWRRWKSPPVEWTRKFAHFTGGLLVAAFPWLFHSPLIVLGLGVLLTSVMAAARSLRALPSIHGVDRRTSGDYFYVLAAGALFWMGHQRPALYVAAVLVMVCADPAAALVGGRYGRWIYRVDGERRSLEGSAVFLLVAFLCVHITLLLLTNQDRSICLVLAFYSALLATGLEALSCQGSDNLIVPLATYAVLIRNLGSPVLWIFAQLAVVVLVAVPVTQVAWRTRRLPARPLTAAYAVFMAIVLAHPLW